MDETAGQGGGAVLAVDLGKTSCRAAVMLDGAIIHSDDSSGTRGLGEPDGPQQAVRAVLDALHRTPLTARRLISAVGIGAAGASASPDGARYVLSGVGAELPAPRVIASDVVTAHVGAFDGEAGSLVISGTGAVGYTVSPDGHVTRADGWGIWLGDEGSGRWIGQQGLIAALRADDGRGPRTRLLIAARKIAGRLEALPAWIAASAEPGKDLGTFAPQVLAEAEAGDTVAERIVCAAVESLTATALAVHDRHLPLCLMGGIAEHPYVRGKVLASLQRHGVRATAPRGDAVRGAAVLASEAGLPHEKQVIREQ